MKNKCLRSLSCLLMALSFLTVSACDLSSYLGTSEGENSSTSSSSTKTESSSTASEEEEGSTNTSTSEGGNDSTDPPPVTEEPDPEKVVDRYERDDIGHKVVYYTDGSFEDLGREVPLNFATPVPTTQYGYQSLAKESDGAGLCAFYAEIYTAVTTFHNSKTDLKKDSEGSYTVAEINYAAKGLTKAQAVAVWKVFTEENPLFYWLDSSLLYTDENLYILANEDYVAYQTRSHINEKIKALALDCDSYLSGLTTVAERALTIYDYLIYKLDYAYEQDGITPSNASWAHNIAGGALYNAGVCETYAQTYDYFCGLFGIECMTVVGMAGEQASTFGGHAWNYLCLDNKWYAVDVTWADQQYLLRDYFGQELTSYNQTHVADLPTSEWGINYQCALPALSQGLCPVLVGEEGGKPTMVSTIDEGLLSMTNERGRYLITVYPATTVTAENGLTVYPYGATVFNTATLPKVGHITFESGVKGYVSEINTLQKITLQSSITMDGLDYDASMWDRGFLHLILKK